MWTVTAVIICLVGQPCGQMPPDHPVFEIAPAMTLTACRIAATDVMDESLRQRGSRASYEVICKQGI